MIEALLGRKIGMTQVFSQDGRRIPVTVIQAGPCVVVQKKTTEKDGYSALQLGFEEIHPRKMTKPLLGHMKASGGKLFRILWEVRTEGVSLESSDGVGKEVTVGIFKVGDVLTIIGRSKGKGFAGVVKRHHYAGGAATHGSMSHRAPGSLGTHTFPGRTIKNKTLMGHMGDERVTVKKVQVIEVNATKNLLLVKGPLPGAMRSLLLLRKRQG